MREAEIEVYKAVAAAGQGPQILYFDEGVRLEEFIESTVLPAQHMLSPGYLEEVAFCIAKFHQIKPQSALIPSQSLALKCFESQREKLLGACQSKLGSNIFSESEKEVVELCRGWTTAAEAEFICKTARLCEEGGLVFSHNDTLANNFLIRPDGSCTLIDYEYAAFNSPIFDIGSYLSETVFDYNEPKPPFFGVLPSPKPEQKRRLIQAYVAAKRLSREEFKGRLEEVIEGDEEVKKEVEQLWKLLPYGELLSHAMWGWWAIIVCKNPLIDFDYLEFAKHRHSCYQALKKTLIEG